MAATAVNSVSFGLYRMTGTLTLLMGGWFVFHKVGIFVGHRFAMSLRCRPAEERHSARECLYRWMVYSHVEGRRTTGKGLGAFDGHSGQE